MCYKKIEVYLKLRSQKGLGLVELMLALALLGLVLALGYSFFFFGTGAFDTGEAQQNVQQNARHAANFITEELRFATKVEILPAVLDPNEVDEGWHYIFVKTEDPNHIYILNNEDGVKPIPGIIADGTTYSDSSLSFEGVGSRVLDFTIAASKNNQNFSIGTRVQPLNLSDNIQGTDDNPVIRYRKDIPELSGENGSNGGDPLPDGYFAFVDLDHNREYDEGIDIPVPLEDLIEIVFNTHGYSNDDYPGLIGTGGSLIIPTGANEIIAQNYPQIIKWEACHDIVIGVNILDHRWEKLSIQAANEIVVGHGVRIYNQAGGEGIVLDADLVTIHENAEIEANGSSGLIIRGANGISAEGAVMNNTNGGGTIKLESKPVGTININGARLNDNEVISGGVVIEGNDDLFAANAIINSKHNADTIIDIQGNIYLNDSILDTGTSGKIDITGGGYLSAERSKMTSRGNAGTEIDINGLINLNHAQIPDGSLTENPNTGHINIKSNNSGIEANDAFIAAVYSHGLTISMTANDDIQINNADLRVQDDNDIEFISGGQLNVLGLELSHNDIGKNTIAKTHAGADVPVGNINGCIAVGTINGENYCNGNGGADQALSIEAGSDNKNLHLSFTNPVIITGHSVQGGNQNVSVIDPALNVNSNTFDIIFNQNLNNNTNVTLDLGNIYEGQNIIINWSNSSGWQITHNPFD